MAIHRRDLNGGILVATIALLAAQLSSLDTTELPEPGKGFGLNKTCGSTDQIALDVEKCSKPAVDMVEGTMKEVPRDYEGADNFCKDLLKAEKCIKDEARRCGKGVQKTIISTIGSSVHRARKRECVKENYQEIIGSLQCVERNTDKFRFMMANTTNIFRLVETKMHDVSRKMNAICCSVQTLKVELEALMDSVCPDYKALVMRLYSSLLDDIVNLVCRSAKCNDVFKGYAMPKFKLPADRHQQSGLISVLMRVIFSLEN